MCRLLVYKGTEPIQISHLVTRPRHSIINQAFESRLRMPSSRPLNADGFGLGWYDSLPALPANAVPRAATTPAPAWSNANLTRLAEKIRSSLVFAHVRASTMAGAPSEDNCHPWMFDKLMWMHNGEINEFPKIKRALQASLPEELFLYPSGYTDSEWAFMVFLSKLKDPHARSFSHVELRDAMMETVHFINKLSKEAGCTGPSLMNFVVTDGSTVVATRYISSRTSEASSLFFSSGTSFDEYQGSGRGLYRMTKADKRENIIMIASEPLTFERSDWMEVKTNTMVVITPKMNLLQIPIIDEYWVPPQDPAALARSRDFAIRRGFGLGFASDAARNEIAAAA
ncbi:glutamine amidotransferase [Cryptococcus wingfieldii CBS 7118]|uniref:Glutamine amidotransferase n=1 Tax=Cryptococcus wingfieldii CBS 7118 TaxID=1295528 RepID=A0A1E3JRX7_9TREE|nr:glutamine amidotransferase [Cryptococcus wingfieldii CBS 7118]ODO03426.1 glutamine amidotransferase [Cryptococcus wingfieldii CBS 7118]